MPRRSKERLERWAIAVVTVLSFVLAARFELHERLAGLLARFERFQADELLLSCIVLSLGLMTYAWRRRAEARRAVDACLQAQREAQALLRRNQELSRRLIGAHESERRSLARDLHDELGQSCTSIRLELATIQRAPDIATAQAAAQRADRSADQLLGMAGSLLRRLRPPSLDSLGLVGAIEQLCEDWELRSGIECTFFHDLAQAALGDETSVALYRVAQEGLSNVVRHSGASRVSLRITLSPPAGVRLVLQDDGCGFSPGRTREGGLGLVGAAERAASVGGRLEVQASPGCGTRWVLDLPLVADPASRGDA